MKKIAVISDPQIDLKKDSKVKQNELLIKCFQNMYVDTVIVCGDITENALEEEWDYFFKCFKQYCPNKRIVIDTW